MNRLTCSALGLALAALAVCPVHAAAPAGGGEIRVAIRADLPNTTPGVARSSISDDVLLHVVEALVAYDGDFNIAPVLAESYEVSEDGRTYTFRLRSGLKFHNGAPVTSREVQWSWQWFMRPETNWLCRNWYDGTQGPKVESVAAPDAYTVSFRLAERNSLFLSRLANVQCLAAVLHPESLDEAGKWRAPVATGPYQLKQWKRGQYVLLERFAGYQPSGGTRSGLAGAKLAQADRIRWMIIPEAASANAALLAGQVHLVYSLNALDVADLAQARGAVLQRSPSLDRNVLLVQSDAPLLRDVRMRRAIAHAIDYAKLAQTMTLGLAHANPSVIAQSSSYYSAAQRQGHRHDAALSRRLLAEAGYRGQPIKLQTNKRFQNMFDSALIIQSMLKRVGINTELEVLEWTTQLDNYYKRKFELMTFGFSGRTDPAFEFETILGDRDASPYVQWGNPEARELIREAGVVADHKRRQELFDSAHRLMIADVTTINLCNHYVIDATTSSLIGYEAWAAAKPRLWGVRLKR